MVSTSIQRVIFNNADVDRIDNKGVGAWNIASATNPYTLAADKTWAKMGTNYIHKSGSLWQDVNNNNINPCESSWSADYSEMKCSRYINQGHYESVTTQLYYISGWSLFGVQPASYGARWIYFNGTYRVEIAGESMSTSTARELGYTKGDTHWSSSGNWSAYVLQTTDEWTDTSYTEIKNFSEV